MPRIELHALDPRAIAWAQLWQVTLTIVVVALGGRLACRRRPHLAYLLWMLVVVKALVPPLLTSPTGLFSWLSRVEAPVAAVTEPLKHQLSMKPESRPGLAAPPRVAASTRIRRTAIARTGRRAGPRAEQALAQ